MIRGLKTFVENLKEHNQYCNSLMDQARVLMAQMEEGVDTQENEQLLSKASKLLKMAGTVFQKFYDEHKGELMTLELFVDARKQQ